MGKQGEALHLSVKNKSPHIQQIIVYLSQNYDIFTIYPVTHFLLDIFHVQVSFPNKNIILHAFSNCLKKYFFIKQ